jgi:hypothetical protein
MRAVVMLMTLIMRCITNALGGMIYWRLRQAHWTGLEYVIANDRSGLAHHLRHLGALTLVETVSVHQADDARHAVGAVLRLHVAVVAITLLVKMIDVIMTAVTGGIGLAVPMIGT